MNKITSRFNLFLIGAACLIFGVAATVKFSALSTTSTIDNDDYFPLIHDATNYTVTVEAMALNLATNAAFSALGGGGTVTSNGVVSLETTRNAAVSNALVTLETTRNAAVSNALASLLAPLFTNVLSVAFVRTNGNDATAVVGVERSPFLTVSNAIIAVRTNGGTVNIGPGRFLSPPKLLLITDHTNNPGTNRLVIQGRGRPFPTTNNNYSTLIADGTTTILEGPFLINRPNVEVTDLGIDCGKVVCTNLFSAVAQEGLLWYSFQQETYTTNTLNLNAVAKRITVLSYETNSLCHALVFENVVDGVMEDIWTCGATHGVVIKGFRVHASRITAQGHSSNGFIIKANDYAAPGLRAGYEGTGIDGSGSISVSGLSIRPLRDYGDTPGLRLDTVSTTVTHMSAINVTGYFYHGAGHMVILDSQATWLIAGVNIDCASYKWGTGAGTISKTGTLASVYVNGASQ